MPEIEDILKGKLIAGARLIRQLEDVEPFAFETLKLLYPHFGNSFIIGITGPPGVEKSCLIDRMISKFLSLGKK